MLNLRGMQYRAIIVTLFLLTGAAACSPVEEEFEDVIDTRDPHVQCDPGNADFNCELFDLDSFFSYVLGFSDREDPIIEEKP